MKLVGLSVLLSIALLTSSVYLVIHQSNRVQNISYPKDDCLREDGFGEDWYIFYHNVCYSRTRFTIVYNSIGGPESIFVSGCLNLYDQFSIRAIDVISITHENC